MTIFETNRLLISKLSITDAPFILELTNTPDWLRYIGDRGIKNLADAENYIVKGPMASYTKWNHGLYRVSLKETGVAIGMCGIIQRDTLADKDIGFALLPEYAGHGYAKEAAEATMNYARQVLGIRKIVAITLPTNQRSIDLLNKLGMKYEQLISFPGSNEELMLFTSV